MYFKINQHIYYDSFVKAEIFYKKEYKTAILSQNSVKHYNLMRLPAYIFAKNNIEHFSII